MRRRLLLVLGLVSVLAAGGALALALLLGRFELGAYAAQRASAALGGRVAQVDSLRARFLSPAWLRVEMRGARLANLDGGSEPWMAEVRRLDLEVHLPGLLRGGPPLLRLVEAEGVALLLERLHDAPRTRNWRFGGAPASAAPVAAPPQQGRAGLPGFRTVRIADASITFRTSGGLTLVTRIDTATLSAADEDAPVTVQVQGSYQGVPLSATVQGGTLRVLRDPATPYPLALRATAPGETMLAFDGTATDPLNADGAAGRIAFAAPRLEAVLRMAGAPVPRGGGPGATLQAGFARSGDLWTLSGATGAFDGQAFTAERLALAEGADGRPDRIEARMALTRLDLDRLEAAFAGSGDTARPNALVLPPPPEQDPVGEARLTIGDLRYAGHEAKDVRLHASVAAGRLALEEVALAAFGARITGRASVAGRHAGGGGAALEASAALEEGELEAIRRAIGIHVLPVSGRLDAHAAARGEGATLDQAIARAQVWAVLALRRGGGIAKEVVEMASTDIRLLFRTPRGTSPIACALGVVTLRGGGTTGEVMPLRIRAQDGTVAGYGSFDLRRRQVDLVVGSQRETTDFFALDIPVRISGPWSDPSIAPAEWSAAGRARLAAADQVAPLPPELRSVAQRNPCYRATGAARH